MVMFTAALLHVTEDFGQPLLVKHTFLHFELYRQATPRALSAPPKVFFSKQAEKIEKKGRARYKEEDIDEVLHMITRHQEYTGSSRAAEILKDWPERIRDFVKVIPGDYKMALQKMEEENAMKMQQNKAQARI